jgi:hypothetical protein
MEESCADIKEKLKLMDKFKKITKLASDYDKGRQTNIIQRTVSQILLRTTKLALDPVQQNYTYNRQ